MDIQVDCDTMIRVKCADQVNGIETFEDDNVEILICQLSDAELNRLNQVDGLMKFDSGSFPDDSFDELLLDIGLVNDVSLDDTLDALSDATPSLMIDCHVQCDEETFDESLDVLLSGIDNSTLYGSSTKTIVPGLELDACKTQGQIWAGCEYVLDQIAEDDMWLDLSSVGRLLASNLGLVNDLLVLLRTSNPLCVCRGGTSPLLPTALTDNYALRNVSGDGNCFYNALSMITFGHQKFQSMFRMTALVTLIFNAQKFREYLSLTANTENMAFYCRKIVGKSTNVLNGSINLIDGFWADSTTIAATSFALRKPIIVVQPFHTMPRLFALTQMKDLNRLSGMLISNYEGSENDVLSGPLVVFLNYSHFQALLQKDGGEAIQVKPNSLKM